MKEGVSISLRDRQVLLNLGVVPERLDDMTPGNEIFWARNHLEFLRMQNALSEKKTNFDLRSVGPSDLDRVA